MVAKGVLREHLILLASSMTCGGNLVGFNTGGYKALSRQLNIQVPFTDATLFTPRKCFEKAAEKRHADSLSSIVASCSWGKHVAVGTGSRFDLVWDPKEKKTDEIEGMDVYNFLQMVKNLANGEEENNACLGEDIDDLQDDEIADWGMSPQHTSGFDAVFDENFELLNGSTSNGWDSNTDQIDQTKNPNDWSGWGQNKSEIKVDVAEKDRWESGSSQKQKADVVQEDTSMSSAWEANANQNSDRSSWARNKSGVQDDGVERAQGESGSFQKWKADDIQEDSRRFNASDQSTNQMKTNSSGWDAWGRNKPEVQEGASKTVQEDSWNSQKWKAEYKAGADITQENSPKSIAWGAIKDTTKPKSNDWSSWGRKGEIQDGSKKVQEDSWNSKAGADVTQDEPSMSSAWGAVKDTTKPKSNDWSSGGRKEEEIQDGSKKVQEDSWNSQKWKVEYKARADVTQEDSPKSSAWGAVEDATKPKSNNWSPWGTKKDEIQDGSKKVQEDSWNSQKWKAENKAGAGVTQEDSPKSTAWGAIKDSTKPKSNDWSSWGRKKEEIQDGGSEKIQEDSWSSGKWKAESKDVAEDSQNKSNQAASSHGWDSQIASANSDSDRNYQWGKQGRESFKKNRFEGSQGWGSNAGDRIRNRPAKPPGPRLDLYSSEEQDILKDIEPIMQSIRRIMQLQGYNDGDPLAADDQLFVLENVFEHHPDKETKMGPGIDYVMVNRHSNFQESRCLYVVLKDGRKEDFSYRKCLDNLIRKKYPDIAESFIGKYFWKPRGRRDQAQNPVGEQARTPAGEQASTPVAELAQTPAAEQAPTPVSMETNEQNCP